MFDYLYRYEAIDYLLEQLIKGRGTSNMKIDLVVEEMVATKAQEFYYFDITATKFY